MVSKKITPYLFLVPSLILVCLFIYYPLIQNIKYSFYEWNTFSTIKEFIGIQNYQKLLEDKIFYQSLKNNVLYAIISMVFQIGGGLVIAAILEDTVFKRFSTTFRTMYFIPVLISTSVIGLLFNFIYDPEGLLNQFLQLIGLGSLVTGWLGNSETAIYAVIAMSQWQSIGYVMMLFIVAIQKIPPTLYEAAVLDGASKIQIFFKLTVPMVKETMIVASVITLSGAFLVFNQVYILTNGGPGQATEVLGTQLFHSAFINGDMGYASTIANIIFVITLILSFLQMKVFKTGKE
ncbi:carbohydrate ABC transporter permease [Neobacillus sp. NPDC097160]|uniref:carbohydrate ABC transporter permease n=1 Tax=Neobacillus sp. NPDC097160 TaxID=3364298 RepID=UPI003817471A